MRRVLFSIPFLLLSLLFALPALAGNWGEDWGTMVWGIAVPAVPVMGWPGLLVVVLMLGLAGTYWVRRPSAGLTVPVLLVLVSIPLAVAAGTVAVPHDFVDGDPAYASEVNANFDAVETAVNDNDSRIGAAQAAADAAQVRVGDSCPAGSSIRAIAADGSVDCEVDTDTDTNTTYSAAAGVILTGTTFTADPSVLQGRVSSECPAGSSIRKISVLGNVTCETDTDTQLSEAEVDAFMADFALSNYRCKGDEYQQGTQSDGTPYCHKKTFANGFYLFYPSTRVVGQVTRRTGTDPDELVGHFAYNDFLLDVTSCCPLNVTLDFTPPAAERPSSDRDVEHDPTNPDHVSSGDATFSTVLSGLTIRFDLLARNPNIQIGDNVTITRIYGEKSGTTSWTYKRIRKISKTSGTATSVFEDWTAWSASFDLAPDISFDVEEGYDYILDMRIGGGSNNLNDVEVEGYWSRP